MAKILPSTKMVESEKKSYTFLWPILVILIFVAVGVGVALSLNKSSSTSSDALNGQEVYGNTEINYYGNATDYSIDFRNALDRINRMVTIPPNLKIDLRTNYQQSSTIASAIMNNNSDIYGGGTIYVNTYRSAPNAGYDDVFVHEIFHVMGYGSHSSWSNQGGVLPASFTNATAKYHELGGTGNIPLYGTGHLDEDTFGTEMMTPAIGTENALQISIVSLGVLQDLGWTVDYSQADAYSLP